MKSVCAVVVTYGKRWHLLEHALASLARAGVSQIIIVDNGSAESISRRVEEAKLDTPITVHQTGRNLGSAGGFALGIEAATQTSHDLVLLLDDDNLLAENTLQKLVDAIEDLLRSGRERAAVLGYRPNRYPDASEFGLRLQFDADSFLSFNLRIILRKIKKKFVRPASVTAEFFSVPVAPYSGLLLPMSLLKSLGKPREDFVLYCDDHEFTSRIKKCGGEIVVFPGADIFDQEQSWNIKQEKQGYFDRWLETSDFRLYYSVRNHAYFEKFLRPHRLIVRALNKYSFLAALFLRAISTNRFKKFLLIANAIRDGEQGVLGECVRYPLPG